MKDESATKDVQKAFALSRPRVKKQPKGVALVCDSLPDSH